MLPVSDVSEGVAAVAALGVLDAVDYGILMLDEQGKILQHNRLAQQEMQTADIVLARGGFLVGCSSDLTAQINRSIQRACRGQRELLLLYARQRELPTAFVPLKEPLAMDASRVLVIMSRQNIWENLALPMFARSSGLTRCEEAVLMGLCRGLNVTQIARRHGVAPSTVRSQVKTLREKTASTSIRELLQRIHKLPPVQMLMLGATPLNPNLAEDRSVGRVQRPDLA
ncbi:hypothetical protein [Hydrogenophaga sp.]|uniref:helix-turn-helix transcriptional regulator n=1 Tax=Hydrogenophaga sp. TaxID=1904254 RepID=UPI0019B4B063|nr:hypothetical protein [Hydrogenophaga sp.]MBD3893011.1 hypothetical protein [Hydrogenophaga sp.]